MQNYKNARNRFWLQINYLVSFIYIASTLVLKPWSVYDHTFVGVQQNDSPLLPLLIFTVIVCVWFGGSANGASHCFSCEDTIMDCNMDSKVCRSQCEKKVPCADENAYCSVATFESASTNDTTGDSVQVLASLMCYPFSEVDDSDITPHFCGTVDEDESYFPWHTCICTHDYCNDAIYLPGAKVPKFPTAEETGGTVNPTSPVSVQKTTSQKPYNTNEGTKDTGMLCAPD